MPPPRTAVWINKRALDILDLPWPHVFRSTAQGWEIEFSGTGAIVAKFSQGGQHRLETVTGDKLKSAGDELYFVPKP